MNEQPNVIVGSVEELRAAVRAVPEEATRWVIKCLPGLYDLGSVPLDDLPGDPRITVLGHGCVFSKDPGSPADAWLTKAHIPEDA